MRKVLFSLLLATTMATPALAQDAGQDDRAAARAERQAQRAQVRQERSEVRQERSQVREKRVQSRDNSSFEAPQQNMQDREARIQARQERIQARQERIQARNDNGFQAQGNVQVQPQDVQTSREVVRERRRDNVNERGRPTLDQRQQMRDSVANWRDDQRNEVTQQQIQQRVERNRVRAPLGARPDRPAPVPETARNNRYRDSHWSTNWRHDRRYDWRNHRRHHRSIFHLGIYFDPFGWGYHRYNIGWRLWPSYYSSNYWLNDPSYYALPYAPWPYKWVRYYDDALMVNIYTGQVVDVIYDFFW